MEQTEIKLAIDESKVDKEALYFIDWLWRLSKFGNIPKLIIKK